MFEKEAEEWWNNEYFPSLYDNVSEVWQEGAEFGYNKANEESMLKLKDEGIVKLLKDSIIRNERLSSQEQQELCVWIECAMDFGENLDECAKELEEANKANEWHYVKDGICPTHSNRVLVFTDEGIGFGIYGLDDKKWHTYDTGFDVIAWKEIVLPELKESE